MPRPARTGLVAWIENLILSYGGREEEEGGSSGRLKAHVIGVGQMSLSQARGSDGPTGLLFLSDGVLQIPAVLTASAWEHLQEKEDRECLTSLINATVILQDYRLQFHMSPEQTKCRFFLSVGELATAAAGPVKHNTPCCTTLPSVRMKICKTWRALLGQEDSHRSQCGLDLSELLGEWQHDCLRDVLEDIRKRLRAASGGPGSPQPSTSAHSSPSTHFFTGWDVDRVRYKGEKCFHVPVEFLCIPEEEFQHLPGNGTQTERGTESAPPLPSAEDPYSKSSTSAGVETLWDGDGSSPVHVEDIVIPGITDRLLSNPWDMFAPPSVSFSPDSSPEATPQPDLAAATSKPDSAAMATSTQLPLHSSKESSYFPPYQKQLSNLLPTSSTPVSPPEAPACHQILTPQQNLLASDPVQENYRKPKRKRCKETPEEEELGGSPPSWLFDSLLGEACVEESSSPTRIGTVLRKTPGTHSDGRPFMYSYKVSGQNLQDFSRFKVSASQLHWAVRYLVAPKKTDAPPDVM